MSFWIWYVGHQMREKQLEMNREIVALRDSKVRLVSDLQAQAQRLLRVQQGLRSHLHRPPPTLPTILPDETPEKRLRYSRATLERYRTLREQRYHGQVFRCVKDSFRDQQTHCSRVLSAITSEGGQKCHNWCLRLPLRPSRVF